MLEYLELATAFKVVEEDRDGLVRVTDRIWWRKGAREAIEMTTEEGLLARQRSRSVLFDHQPMSSEREADTQLILISDGSITEMYDMIWARLFDHIPSQSSHSVY